MKALSIKRGDKVGPVVNEEFKREMTMDEHKVPLEELVKRLGTNLDAGLTTVKAEEVFLRDGPNALMEHKGIPEWLKLVKILFMSGFALLLWVGSALCLFGYIIDVLSNDNPSKDYIYLSSVLAFVVVVTGLFQYYQFAQVYRDGEKVEIPTEKLVVGDVVAVNGGDRIPADIRIVVSQGLKVDNSSLTGESISVSRSTECTSDNPLETKNMAFFSTFAVEGAGKGVVVNTADRTAVGRIAHLAAHLDQGKTPIARELEHFIRLVTYVAVFFGVLFFIISVIEGTRVMTAIIFLIGIIVANVPEGILATVTVCLSITAKRMASRNCLVKNLEAVETLGSTSTICSDKTGTLTQNRMTVSHLWYDRNSEVCHAQSIPSTQTQRSFSAFTVSGPRDDAYAALLRIGVLCNRSEFKPAQRHVPVLRRECTSDPSESALLRFTEMLLGDVMSYRARHPKVLEMPFNSTNKYQLSVHEIGSEDEDDDLTLEEGRLPGKRRSSAFRKASMGGERTGSFRGYLLVMKGAPERIVDLCSTIITNNVEQPFDAEAREDYNRAYLDLGGMGERVLGFADLRLDPVSFPRGFQFETEPQPNFPVENLRFVGLISLVDPPRAAVPSAVAKARAAGINVVMVTGDHPITAKAIARAVGILSDQTETVEDIAIRRGCNIEDVNPREATAIVVHGSDLKEMTSAQLDALIRSHREIVFARTSPQQKLLIVESFQRTGQIVAVTGDGVNDSPALKKADIGIAMGIVGSDVSKQAADMILLDDNFASIIVGVEEGRRIFDNFKKAISYTLRKNVAELIPFLAYIVFGLPLPLGTITMLCIDLGTDIIPSISIGYEKAESDIMNRPPRNPKTEKLVNWKVFEVAYFQIGWIQAMAGFFAYFWIMAENGWRPLMLWKLRDRWDSMGMQALEDSYGQQWTYQQRKSLEYTCQTAFFVAIVVTQWADVLISKTRRLSLVQHGIGNWRMNVAILLETIIASVLIYTPIRQGLNMNALLFSWWFPGLAFAIFLYNYDELRKMCIRNWPGGWAERELYF